MSIQSYSQIYDFKKKKYLSLEKKEGKNLFNKYVEIYNCLNEQGKKKISQLYNLPDLSIDFFLNCKNCSYKNKDLDSKYCCQCGNKLNQQK